MKLNNVCCVVKTISVNLKYYTKALLVISLVSFVLWQTAKTMSAVSVKIFCRIRNIKCNETPNLQKRRVARASVYSWNTHDSFKIQLPPSSFVVAKDLKEKTDTINVDVCASSKS
jgi:hypothetical protein